MQFSLEEQGFSHEQQQFKMQTNFKDEQGKMFMVELMKNCQFNVNIKYGGISGLPGEHFKICITKSAYSGILCQISTSSRAEVEHWNLFNKPPSNFFNLTKIPRH